MQPTTAVETVRWRRVLTSTLGFGTSVYVAPLRDVESLAKSVDTCAAFGPGRVMCGVGAGWMQEFVAVGQDFLPREKRLDEMLEVLGVDGVVIPARTLATTSDTDDVIAGIERYSARR